MFEWYWVFPFLIALHIWIVPLFAIFFHRAYAHGQVRTSPRFDAMARISLWMAGISQLTGSPGAYLRYWVAVHRKHHKCSDTAHDPHTPQVYNRYDLLMYPKEICPGTAYYLTPDEVNMLAADVPEYNDRIEHFSHHYRYLFWVPFVALSTILFGWAGTIAAAIMLIVWYLWPRVHICISHSIGYRNQPTLNKGDRSLNFFPIGILFGGEDLAANHHDYPHLANLKLKWYEFDLGWHWMKFYQAVGLLDIVPEQHRDRYLDRYFASTKAACENNLS